MHGVEYGLGHIEHGAGAETCNVGPGGAEVEQRAADGHPVDGDVGPERGAQRGDVPVDAPGVAAVEGDARGVGSAFVERLEHGRQHRAELGFEVAVTQQESDDAAHGSARRHGHGPLVVLNVGGHLGRHP